MYSRKVLWVLQVIIILFVATATFAQSAKIRGRVLDTTGAVMAGADVQVYRGDTLVQEGRTEGSGEFDLEVPEGEYILLVAAPDFEPHTEFVLVTPELGPLTITLDLAQVTENVEVTAQLQELSIAAEGNLSATVLGEDFISQLPEDEEELLAVLQALAGPSAGPGGSQFIIDGFSSGRVPPRSQIMEIRINNNPFSTEFSRPGWGRTEIITRAGGGNFRGQFGFQFKDASLNARNPMSVTKPPFQQRNFNTNFSGPIIPGRFTLSMDARHNESENSGTIRAITPTQSFSQGVTLPSTNRNIGTRGQYQLTQNNLLNFNLRYGTNKRENQGVGDFSLPERASDSMSRSFEFQIRESAVINNRLIHEARFSVSRDRSSNTPRHPGTAINVLDAFNGGGNPNISESRSTDVEFGNMLMYNRGRLSLKTGFQGLRRDTYSLSQNNFLGTFVFSSLEDYLAGQPTTYTVNQGNPLLEMKQFETATFLQTDWRFSPRFTFSAGVRHEAQTNLSDWNNFDPRIGFAYQLNDSTVIRGGSGMFHERLNANTVQQLLRFDGTRQHEIVIRNPSYPDPFVSGDATVRPPASIRLRDDDLVAPYTINSSISVERRLPLALQMSTTYEFVRGIHQLRGRNINAPLPGTQIRPDPTQGNLVQLESTGLSREHSLRINLNRQFGGRIMAFGNYTLRYGYADSDGPFSLPMDNYNLALDWGRSNNDTRHNINANLMFSLPWDVRLGSRVFYNSGRPYNITTGYDDNGDTVTNDRPAGLPRNAGTGPNVFDMSFNISKVIRLGRGENSPDSAGMNPTLANFAQPQRGGGGGGFGGQFPGGGGGQRGGRDGFGQPSRYQLQLFADIRNVLNNTQFANVSGVMTSPFFGRPTAARNPRDIQLGLRLNF